MILFAINFFVVWKIAIIWLWQCSWIIIISHHPKLRLCFWCPAYS